MAKPEGRFSWGTIVALVLLIGCLVLGLTDYGTVVIEYSTRSELDDIHAAIRDKVQTIRNQRGESSIYAIDRENESQGESIYPPNPFELMLQDVAYSAEMIMVRYKDDIETLEKTDEILKNLIESLVPNTTATNQEILNLYLELQRVEADGWSVLEPLPDIK